MRRIAAPGLVRQRPGAVLFQLAPQSCRILPTAWSSRSQDNIPTANHEGPPTQRSTCS